MDDNGDYQYHDGEGEDDIEAIDINNLTDEQLRQLAKRAGYEIDELDS